MKHFKIKQFSIIIYVYHPLEVCFTERHLVMYRELLQIKSDIVQNELKTLFYEQVGGSSQGHIAS